MSSLSSTGAGPASTASASPGDTAEPRNRLRMAFGVVLFVAWGLLTYLWVASTVYLVAHGTFTAAITAVGAVAVLLLLGGMEGLEVSVIDRWQNVWPRTPRPRPTCRQAGSARRWSCWPPRRPGRWMSCRPPGRTGCAARSRSPQDRAATLRRCF